MSGAAPVRDRIQRLFPVRADALPRVGAEVELLAFDAASRGIAPLRSGLLPAVRSHARDRGWRETRSDKGAPRFVTATGGAVTFEPGGQLEYATPPYASPCALLADLAATVQPLVEHVAEHGVALIAAGIDPFNDADAAPLQAPSERYCAMDAYFATIGPAGRRMMRQTASVQLNIGVVHDAALQWRVLNAIAPSLVAIFASSGTYAARATGYASYRAETWRRLDPSRTGLWYDEADPIGGYVARALNAPVMLAPRPDGYAPLRDLLAKAEASAHVRGSTGARGGGARDFDDAPFGDVGLDALLESHLSTLFPEVRPRGYFEVRSMDAVAPRLYPAAVVLVAAIVWDRAALEEASRLLGAPDEAMLAAAGETGLANPTRARTAADLVALARDAADRLGPDWCDPADAESAFAFFEAYTLRGRSPRDDEPAAAAAVGPG